VGRLIVVGELVGGAGLRARTAVYARVTAWATDQQITVDQVVVELGSVLNGYHRKFLALMRDHWVHRFVVQDRVWFCGFGSEYVQAALSARGRELVVVDAAKDDDLVRDMTEILTSMCAGLYGKRAAGNRATRALAAAAATEERGAA